jgi:O-antigen/teichoic acid export membrane protein
MGLAFIPLYIRFLGIEAYGLIGIFALLQVWLSLLDLGLTPTISREMARFTGGGHDPQSIRDLLRSVEIIAFGVAGLVALAIWLTSGWLATHWLRAEALPLDVVANALRVMGIVVALRFVESIYRSSIIGLQHQVRLNAVVAVAATLRGAGAVLVLALISPSVTAFFVWQGVVSAISVCLLWWILHRSLPASTLSTRLSLEPLRNVWRFAAGTVLLTLLGLLLSQTDKVILSSILSLGSFAIYSLAYTGASAVRLLAIPIDQAVFPRLTQLYQEGDEAGLARLYHKATQYSAVLMGGIGLFLIVFGREVLALWTGDDDLATKTYAVLWILVIGMVLNGVMNTPFYLQMAAGWTDLLVKMNAVMVVVFVPMIYVLTQRFGVTGAAASWVLLNLAYVVVVVQVMHRRLLTNELKDWYTRDILLPLLAGAVAAFVLRQLFPIQAGTFPMIVFLGLSLTGILIASSLAANDVRTELVDRLYLTFRQA